MQWRGRRQSSNIEDRRGQGGIGGGDPFGRGGSGFPTGGRIRRVSGGGLSGIIVLVVLFFIFKALGIDPMLLLDDGSGTRAPGYRQEQTAGGLRSPDQSAQFVATVLASTEDTWTKLLAGSGISYPPPKLVLFSGATRSECGAAQSATGPFYCPRDRKIYLDLSFYDELASRLGAAGDFAQAYVLAHEVGHHVQNLIGVLPKYERMRAGLTGAEANAMSVRVELQADCFAGVWGFHTRSEGLLDPGDLDEALNAAEQIGDDRLQKRGQGYVVPDSFTHGTSAQRKTWFMHGFETGRVESCNTFGGSI